jgi:hypothetical protein
MKLLLDRRHGPRGTGRDREPCPALDLGPAPAPEAPMRTRTALARDGSGRMASARVIVVR